MFLAKYQAKYEGACECLRKDREALVAFYDFPAEHWKHLRTTNPIESTFATIRLRHRRTKGNGTKEDRPGHDVQVGPGSAETMATAQWTGAVGFLLQGRVFVNGVVQDAA